MLIEELHEIKDHKPQTLYTAVRIADRYLTMILDKDWPLPCLVTLAVTSLLMGAKIEEPMGPSVIFLLKLLKEKHSIELKKEDVLNLEESILRLLDFNLRSVSPIDFLERYIRIFDLDSSDSARAKQTAVLSYDYCKFMQRHSCFLPYRSSELAAASLLFSIAFRKSKISRKVLGSGHNSKDELERQIEDLDI